MLSSSALDTAKALLAGELPLAESLGLKLEYSPNLDDDRLAWLFEAEGLLQNYSAQESRYLVIPRGILTSEEDSLFDSNRSPAPELVARAFNAAAESALRTLAKLAEESDDLSFRFRARLCVACREELTVLLNEHSETTTQEGS